MRTSCLLTILAIAISLSGCARREEPTAREAGREAYQAGQAIKKGAKEAAREIKDVGKEFSEGWKEAQRKDAKPRKK
jgi:predicted small secreted protein